MNKKTLIGSIAVWLLVGCGSSSSTEPATDASIDPDAGGSETQGDDAIVTPTDGAPADTAACAVDGDCASLLGSVTATPVGCAEAYCSKSTSACGLRAIDKDLDGYRTAQCDVPGFSAFEKGNDCDDNDKAFSPGKSRDCSAGADGTAITWPSGKPQGECKYGTEACGADGKTSACAGAVAPAKAPTCSSDLDSTCVGRKDSALCGCKLDASESCYDGAAATLGKGPCKAGTHTCVADPADKTKTLWGPCVGQTVPKLKDGCLPTSDDNCDGVPHDGCTCWQNVPNDAVNCMGDCTNGAHICDTATGTFSTCSGTANKTTVSNSCGSCSYCGTTPCAPPATVTVASVGCGSCSYCAGSTPCSPAAPITVTGTCSNCTYCPGAPACTPVNRSTCYTAGDGACGGTSCPGGACSGPATKACGSCPAVPCGAACKSRCPAGWTDYGSYCELFTPASGGFGVTTAIGWMPGGSVASAAGWADAGSYVNVWGGQSRTDHCGTDPNVIPMDVYCNGGLADTYSERNFYDGVGESFNCGLGQPVTPYHRSATTVCCGGGCARNYTLEIFARVYPCGG